MGFTPEIIEFYAENYYQIFTTFFLNFCPMPNLDIIYDVTIAVAWDEINTNEYIIYQLTCLPSFVTFDSFYVCLWHRTLSFGGSGGKSSSNQPPCTWIVLSTRWQVLSFSCNLYVNTSRNKSEGIVVPFYHAIHAARLIQMPSKKGRGRVRFRLQRQDGRSRKNR